MTLESSPITCNFPPFPPPTPQPRRHSLSSYKSTNNNRIRPIRSPHQEPASARHAPTLLDETTDHIFPQIPIPNWTPPDGFSLARLLKSSSQLPDSTAGEQLHAMSLLYGLSAHPHVRSSLIVMYSTFGRLEDAQRVFDETPPILETDVPSWNSIISTYALHGELRKCFALFSSMLEVGDLSPNAVTYSILIKSCTRNGDVEAGRIVHGLVIKDGSFDKTKALNCLITLYAKTGDLDGASKVFGSMDGMNVISWNAILSGYEQNGEFEVALRMFRRMVRFECDRSLASPNRITYLSVLSAVSAASDLIMGREVHTRMIRLGLEQETSIANSIITMYMKCGEVAKGKLVFGTMSSRDLITWNSMLNGYAQNKQSSNSHELFREMQSLGIEPDDHTLTILLGTLSSEESMSDCSKLGREVHGYLVRRTVEEASHVTPYNAIMAMYARSSRIGDAEKLFKVMKARDSISWNTMMDGYSLNGFYDEAIELFIDMKERGLQPDPLTFSILLTVCGRLASIGLGKQFHALVIKHQFHHSTNQYHLLSINNTLVSMYSKCGSIGDAEKVFRGMVRRDVLSWTAIITGYAHHGMVYKSLEFFEMMRGHGVRPNSVTFLGLLTACAHAGLVEHGTKYFTLMSDEFGVEPEIEHYGCMVDLFGQLGEFERAEAMVEYGISQLGETSGICLWKVLLGACHAHKQLDLGVRAGTRVLELDPEDETTHVLLSNLYAAFGLWEDSIAVRRLMRDRGLKKEAGCSWVEVGHRRHVFAAGDSDHYHRKTIYEKLNELDERCRAIGYIPMTEFALHDVDEAQKEAILSSHSERLAVSFALVQGTGRGAVRVIKNLRVCGDCHNWMKYASRVEEREIILRDSKRFHCFKDGRCSCGDYW